MLRIMHKGSSKLRYWRSPMGRAQERAFWRDLAARMFGP